MNHLNHVLDSIPDLVLFSLDHKFRYTYFNEAHRNTMKHIWGEEIELGKSMLDYIHVLRDKEKAKDNFERCLKGEKFVLIEEYGDDNFDRRYFRNTYTPVRNDKNEVQGVSVYVTDISERRKEDIQKNEREEFFRTLIRDSAEGILVLEKDSLKIAFANPAICEALGYTPQELYRIDFLSLYDPGDWSLIEARIELLEKEERIYSKGRKLLSKEKKSIYFDISSSIINIAGTDYIMAFYTDVTRARENEELIEEFEQLFNVSNDMMAIARFDGKLEHLNPQWAKVLGYTLEELQSESFLNLVHPDDRERTARETEKLYKDKKIIKHFENRYRTKGGEYVWLEWNTTAIHSKKRAYSVARNITAFKKRQILQDRITNSLYKLSSYQEESQSYEKSLQKILDEVADVLSLDRLSYWAFSADQTKIVCDLLISEGEKNLCPNITLKADEFPNYFRAISSERIVAADDAEKDSRTKEFVDNYFMKVPVKSLLDVQVNEGERKVGVICAEQVSTNRRWTFDEKSYMISVAEIIGKIYSSLQRKETLRRLSESEELFKEFTNFLPGQAYIKDLQGKHIYANKSQLAYLGVSLDEYRGTTAYDYFDKEYADQLTREDQECILSGDLFTKEFRYRRNKQRWAVEYKFPIYHQDKLSLIGGIVLDITEQKEAEMERIRSKRQLELAIATANLGVWEFNKSRDELIWNQQMHKIYELTEEEFQNKTARWFERVHDDDKPKVQAEFDRIDRGGKIDRPFRYRIETKTGKIKHILASGTPVLSESGTQENMMGINIDVTNLIEKENELKRKNAMQELLVRISTTYINLPLEKQEDIIQLSLKEMSDFVEADRSYVFEYYFDKGTCSNIYEYTSKGVLPQINNLQNVSLDYASRLVESHQKRDIFKIDDVSKLQDEKEREFFQSQGIKSLITVPMIMNDKCIGFIGFDSVRKYRKYSLEELGLLKVYSELLVNMKNRTRDQEEMNQLLSKTISQNTRLKDFSFITSHNIRSYVANVLGLSQLVQENPENQEFLQMLKSTTENLDLSVRNLGELLYSEEQKLTRSTLNIKEVLDRLLVLQKDIITEKEADIHCHVPETLEIETVPVYFESILHNLISNALKHGVDAENKQVTIDVQYEKESFTFAVEDFGKGVNLRKHEDRLFKLGSRFHSETAGQGMGLFLVKYHVEYLRGEVDFKSEPGIGTRVEVTFYEEH